MSKQKYYRPIRIRHYPTVNNEPSMTDVSQAVEADINVIVDRFLKRGIIPHIRNGGQYLDTTTFPDLQAATNAVVEAQDLFLQLPSWLRERFANSPQALFSYLEKQGTTLQDYLNNPENFKPKAQPSVQNATAAQPSPGAPNDDDDQTTTTTQAPRAKAKEQK